MTEDLDRDIAYRAVVNHEEQYSIWPLERDIPAGWRDAGKSGSKEECLAFIEEVWTDMRPLSLRKWMDEMAAARAAGTLVEDTEPDPWDEEDTLVARLSTGSHPVEISLRPEPTGPALREAIERSYVFVKFTDTRGGTELGVPLDRDASDWSSADFDAPSGRIRLVGDLTLDFEPVRCTAEIDLATMTGQGHLTVLAAPP